MTIKEDGRTANKHPMERALITTGALGGVLAAICCATPVLGLVLGALGLSAWIVNADYVLIPTLLVCLGLLGIGLYRRRLHHE
jgi:mercuric ion transport protein